MSDDTTERLRKAAQNEATVFALRDALRDSESEIKRLQDRVTELEGALSPFAEVALCIPPGWDDGHSLGEWALGLDVADLRRALSAFPHQTAAKG